MKFTLAWLKKFLETESTLDEITQGLNEIGLEVEEVIDRSTELENFQVAHIISTSPHPTADKLQICDVETINGNIQVVCAATNARKGLKVVLAKIGTIIPSNNLKIKESEIRGVKSYGMLCSEEELLIRETSDGIIELPAEAKVGEQFIKYYGLDDPVFHIEVTPNRADALCVYGIARDLAAKGLGALKPLETTNIITNFNSDFAIDVKDTSLCDFFAIRELKNLKNCESPNWLKIFLNNIGVGSISAIVDVTNYVLYTFGQPLHAYDRSKITGNKLVVGNPVSDKPIDALNNKQYCLSQADLTISDLEEVQCLAGIIGAKNSACDSSTTNIILEAASFNPKAIAKSGRRHNIITDSRHRFERCVNSAFTTEALDIATSMILSICAGSASQIISQGTQTKQVRTIEFSLDFFTKISGFILPEQTIFNILQSLGFGIELKNKILSLTIPSWRSDISIREDIVEEILRIYGYDKLIPIELPRINIEKTFPKEQRRFSDVKRILAGIGYNEIVSWSFLDKNLSKLFAPIKDDLTIQNPISSDLNYMRPSIIPNLLKAANKNFARSIKDLSLFEVGPIFNGKEPTDEKFYASGIRTGSYSSKNAHSSIIRDIDVFDVKGDLEELLNSMNLNIDKCQINDKNILSYYHPTRAASLQLGNNTIGYFGELHPSLLKHFGIEQKIYAFELNLTNIPYGKSKFGYRELLANSDFQKVVRDFAFIVDRNQKVGEILSFVRNIDKKLIKSVELFDIYLGDNIAPETKSIALSVNIQADDRTLTEQELGVLSDIIINGVAQKFQGILRK